MDERCRAAVGAGGLAVRVLGENGGDAHGNATLLLVFSLGLGLNLADDAAALCLALIGRQVLQARQGRELDVERGRKLRREHVLAALAGGVFGTGVEPRTAQKLAGGKGGDAVGSRPGARRPDQALFGAVGQGVAQASMRRPLIGDDDGAIVIAVKRFHANSDISPSARIRWQYGYLTEARAMKNLTLFSISAVAVAGVVGSTLLARSGARAGALGGTAGSGCNDLDGDGYGIGCAAGNDCNDRDPAIHPGAVEICNFKDDD